MNDTKTITDVDLAELMWNTVIVNDMFDEKLLPVRGALREACRSLVGCQVVASEEKT